MNHRLDKSTDQALDFLQSQQQDDGSFLSYSSAQPYDFVPMYTYKTTFANSTILHCLSSVKHSRAKELSKKLAAYISSQSTSSGTYNYWDKDTPEYTQQPYPNDLDDTFCALSALSSFDTTLIDGRILAQATYALLQTESNAGGPYTTWLTGNTMPQWRDVDIAVNANVLYFLNLRTISQPNLKQYISEAIQATDYYSPYYPSQYHVLYFVARAASVEQYQKIAAFATKLASVSPPRSPLENALLICILTVCQKTEQVHIHKDQLSTLQQADGSWAASAFCIDPSRDQQKYYNGSPALTTAFALHALHTNPSSIPTNIHTDASKPHITSAYKTALTQIKNLEDITRIPLSNELKRYTISSNASEIIASAYFFDRSLPCSKHALSPNLLYSLSAANLYGWIAYTIYDDLIDEGGDPGLLPLANIAQRQALLGFSRATAQDSKFQHYIEETFDRIDTANAWELEYCRVQVLDHRITIGVLPDFGDRTRLAEKSIGHALPILGITTLQGNGVGSKPFQKLETALTHYLIARQLHDDIHDWQEDLEHGHISFVVASLLSDQNISGTHNVKELITRLQNTYWRSTLPKMCQVVKTHLQKAHLALTEISYEHTTVTDLLHKLDLATQETLEQQKNTLLFLDTYTALTKNRH